MNDKELVWLHICNITNYVLDNKEKINEDDILNLLKELNNLKIILEKTFGDFSNNNSNISFIGIYEDISTSTIFTESDRLIAIVSKDKLNEKLKEIQETYNYTDKQMEDYISTSDIVLNEIY